MKRLLLTNDDGLSSPGLIVLAEELVRTGRYDLRIVAPEKEQSGVGHCITIHQPLFAEKVSLPDLLAGAPAYHVAGTPADCVKLGLTNLFPDFKPDLVVSGINRGPNVGVNVLYSGTVAAALEACINGVPAVALSLDIPANGIWHFALASSLSVIFIDEVLARGLPSWTALNVNFPNRPEAEIRGIRLTRHGKSGFKEYYIEEQGDGRWRRFRLEGSMTMREDDATFDAVAMREGWISATPLGLCLADGDTREGMRDWNLFNTWKR
jgi:5'-nucleotidase